MPMTMSVVIGSIFTANAVFHGMRVIAAIHVRHGKPVVEEAQMELAFLEDAREMTVISR